MNWRRRIAIVSIFLFTFLTILSAQVAKPKGSVTDKKSTEEKLTGDDTSDDFLPNMAQNDASLYPLAPVMSLKTKGIQYGGWLTPTFITDQKGPDGTTTSLTTSINTLKLWFKAYLVDNSFVYLRVKDVFTYVIDQKQYSFDKTDNLFDLDLAFVSLYNNSQTMRFYLGRKFFTVGTGLVLDGRGDGAEFDLFTEHLDVKLFAAYTGLIQKDNNLYQLSDRDISDGAKRLFAGFSVSSHIQNQKLYLFGMAQTDYGKEDGDFNTRYQSQYYGAGLDGVFAFGLKYYGEAVYEFGFSHKGTADNMQEDISALAAICGLNYFIETILNPVLMLQYAYGSGDTNRVNYGSSIGNMAGEDRGFISFGTFIGGYALRPMLGNMHIIRGGFAISPFSWYDGLWLRRMTLITKYSYYLKDKDNGVINNGEALIDKRTIGQGVDVALRWKIFSDLSAFVNYAIFLPGEAYTSAEADRHFFLFGLNISF